MEEPSSAAIQLMSREEVERRVVKTISANLGMEADGVGPGSPPRVMLARSFKDLGADSLDLYSIMLDLEEELAVQIPDREAQKFATVADAVEFIVAHTRRPGLSTGAPLRQEKRRGA